MPLVPTGMLFIAHQLEKKPWSDWHEDTAYNEW